MGVVDLKHVFLVEVGHGAKLRHVLLRDALHRGGNKEILLLKPQGLALLVVVVGVKDLGNHLRHGLVLRGLEILALGVKAHIHGLGGFCVPQSQLVGMAGVIPGDFHIAGDGQHRGAPLLHNVEMPVVPKLPQRAAEADLPGLLRLWQQPCGADALPRVGQLHLLALHNFLLKNPQFIADGIPCGGNFQRAHGIQIACGQTAQAAVAKARVRLQLEHISGLKAQMLQRFLQLGQHPQIIRVFLKAPPHQKFKRQIVDLLLLLLAGFPPGFHAPQGHGVPQHQRTGAEHLRLSGFLGGFPKVNHQLAGQRVFQFPCCKCRHLSALSADSSFLSALPFLMAVFLSARFSSSGAFVAGFPAFSGSAAADGFAGSFPCGAFPESFFCGGLPGSFSCSGFPASRDWTGFAG
ncbi:hypothetical protein SDC9_114939 [bioreactor metagenome]|uniref:Uncharacterized protein n=1 Tax=bioreactor metagenome TaxID=1076179 RepID=A0A645BY22_9ZZZZ